MKKKLLMNFFVFVTNFNLNYTIELPNHQKKDSIDAPLLYI